MKKLIITLIVLAAIGGAGYAYYKYKNPPVETKVTSLPVSRGDIVESVGATGTLQAVTTVVVGSQVSGQIKALYADFNQIVKKGQIIAELDPSLLQTQIQSQRANLVRSQADLDRLKVSLEDAQTKLKRTESLAARKLVAPQELEAAQIDVKSAEAQIKSSEASLVQSQASLNQAEVNLQHTIIEAPMTASSSARRRRGPDGRGQHERADAVHDRGRPLEDAGQRQHRRGGRRPHAPRAGRQLPGRRVSRGVPRRGLPGAPAADARRTWSPTRR